MRVKKTAKNTASGITTRRKTMNNFIELHDIIGKPLLVNTRNITSVMHSSNANSGTLITMTDENYVNVTESYEEVKRLLATVEYVYKEEE